MKAFALLCLVLALPAQAQFRALPIEDNAFIRHCESYAAVVAANRATGSGLSTRHVPAELQWQASYVTVNRLIQTALSRAAANSGDRHAYERSGGAIPCQRAFEILNTIEALDLSGQDITDVAPLAGLHRLRTLVLRSPVASGLRYALVETIQNIDDLAALQNLEYIDLSGQAVSDISALGQLPRLRYAVLRHTAVRRSLPLASAPALLRVDFTGTPVTDFAALQRARPDLRIVLGPRR